MSETYRTSQCRQCKELVSYEDSIRTSTCDCDPYCVQCGVRFIPSERERVCEDCLEQAELAFESEYPKLYAGLSLREGTLQRLRDDLRRNLEREGGE